MTGAGVRPEILGRKKLRAPALQEYLDKWGPELESLAEAFLRGDARVDPKHAPGSASRSTCDETYCHLRAVCRMAEIDFRRSKRRRTPMNSTSVKVVREPADAAVRKAVIDYRRSFIVQAPAGSGKTELLIQRFLNLLANAEVAEPEAILAITFTRKAANEMRNRILSALDQAATSVSSDGDGNSKLTQRLATAAVQRDRQRRWAILENPGRLQVRTVDSFCDSITGKCQFWRNFQSARKSAKIAMRSTSRLPSGRCDCWRIPPPLLHRLWKPCCAISTIIFSARNCC